jgi:CRP/FNR family transcriptional regulator, cyclic AMP receptor protein
MYVEDSAENRALSRSMGVISPAGMAGMRSAEVVELLARVPVLSTLMTEDLERIADLAVPRAFEPGQVVFREGDASDTCYIVRSGRARAVREHSGGRTITLATFGPGDIFGELALFEDERRSATVEAIEQTSVVAVLGPDMRRLMVEHPGISARLVIALGRRLRETNERLSRQSFQTVQSRVAVVLSELVAQELATQEGNEQQGSRQPGEPVERAQGEVDGDVLVTATQADLAQLAGSSRESASRFLAVLERAGVISQGRGRLVVHDREALRQYVF